MVFVRLFVQSCTGRRSFFGNLVLVAACAVCLHSSLLRRSRRACLPPGRGQRGARVFSECGWRIRPSRWRREVSGCGRGGVLGAAGCSDLDPGHVGGQVVGGPAVTGDEGRGLRELVESRAGSTGGIGPPGCPAGGAGAAAGSEVGAGRWAATHRERSSLLQRWPSPARQCMRPFLRFRPCGRRLVRPNSTVSPAPTDRRQVTRPGLG